MGIIWITLGVLVLGLFIMWLCAQFYSDTAELIGYIGCIMVALSIISVLILGGAAITNNLTAKADFTELQIQHGALVYQLNNNLYDNDNDLGMKDLYNEIVDYNQKVARGRINSKNGWISVFYPLDYDSLELIKLPQGE